MVGYLPLALEVAGAQLKQLFDVSLADYQAELEAGGLLSILTNARTPVEVRHEMGLKAVLESQWRRLPQPEMRQLLRVAGQNPEAAQIPGPRLGLLAGIPEKGQSIFDVTLTRALNTLVDASLVEQLEGDLVRLHPLMRDFARQQVAEAERETFLHKCALKLADAYEDFTVLEKQCAGRGIDAVQEDLLSVLELVDSNKSGLAGLPINIPPWRYIPPIKGKVTVRITGRNIDVPEVATPRLQKLLRLVQREVHTLRGWQPEQQPIYFGQQMAYRLQDLGLKELLSQCSTYLRRKAFPYLQSKWMNKQESLTLERTLAGHSGWVRAVAVTPDGRRAISASEDRTLKVWDLSTGKELASIVLDGSLYCLAVATDGLTIVTGDGAGSVYCLRYEEPGAAASVSASLPY
jgi:hypothetical protein